MQFGDTVNTASRMESTGQPSCIHVSEETWRLLGSDVRSDPRWQHTAVEVRGQGLSQDAYICECEALSNGAGLHEHGGHGEAFWTPLHLPVWKGGALEQSQHAPHGHVSGSFLSAFSWLSDQPALPPPPSPHAQASQTKPTSSLTNQLPHKPASNRAPPARSSLTNSRPLLPTPSSAGQRQRPAVHLPLVRVQAKQQLMASIFAQQSKGYPYGAPVN